MAGPHPATAAVRLAVREVLGSCGPGDLVLAAVSGGADSLALAEGLAYAARTGRVRAGAVVVDHGLQPGSAAVAARAAETCRGLGLDPVEMVAVEVRSVGEGLEAAARAARYAALEALVDRVDARLVLLGHTRDDQAEQVLLGLTRGAGTRSLSGMPPARGRFRRPLLALSREQTRAACAGEGLRWWDDPMNEDSAYLRVRARRALGDLERDLGPGIAAALARTAEQLRADADLLDALADEAVAALGEGPWAVADLAAQPDALRGRVWRRLVVAAGAPAGQVSTRHTDACDRLLTHWRGQGAVHAPGGVRVRRTAGDVAISAAPG